MRRSLLSTLEAFSATQPKDLPGPERGSESRLRGSCSGLVWFKTAPQYRDVIHASKGLGEILVQVCAFSRSPPDIWNCKGIEGNCFSN